MATPIAFTADMLKNMAKLMEERQSLLVSAGFRHELSRAKSVAVAPVTENPLLAGYAQSYAGIQIEPVNIPPEKVIDWSECRSPSRAKRRHARGIPQRIKVEHWERAYLINRDAPARYVRDMEARMIAAIYFVPGKQ